MRKIGFIVLLVLGLTSCKEKSVFNTYEPIAGSGWHKDSIINFNFEPIDTISKNNLYINLRNNNDYSYSNLFLIVHIDFPSNTQIIDTLEYEMTTAAGKFLGDGFTDLKENKLEYKTNVVFPTTGLYKISVQQAMRKSGEVEGIEHLEGITDVGLQIEKSEKND